MNKSYLIAGALSVVVCVWLASGMLKNDEVATNSQLEDSANFQMIVITEDMLARPITPFIIANGNLMPDRIVGLKTETNGQVESIFLREGSTATKGQSLIQLGLDDRLIRQEQAELKIEERRRNYESALSLVERDFGSQREVDAAQLELKMAEVELAQIELEVEKTTIRAPFDGILEEMNVEIGQYLSVGNDVLILVDNNPLVVDVRIPQQNVHTLSIGQQVRVILVDGEEVTGNIRFIASRGDEATRTFRVEIEIVNDGHLRAGSSATAYIPQEEVKAHFISGGLLTLDSDGQMGVKTVDDRGLVSFYPVKVEYSEADGMWVSGMPENVQVITSGQGFADVGQTVIVDNKPPISGSESQIPLMLEGVSNASLD